MTIQTDIAEIVSQHADTRTRVRLASNLLWSKYKEKPSSPRLRALLNAGSMTTIQDELNKWWTERQSKDEVQATLTALPPSLQQQGSDMLDGFWRQAQIEAAAAFDEERGALERKNQELSALHVAAEQKNGELCEQIVDANMEAIALRAGYEQVKAESVNLTRSIADVQAQLSASQATIEQNEITFGRQMQDAESRHSAMVIQFKNEHTEAVDRLNASHEAKQDSLQEKIERITAIQAAGEESIKRIKLELTREVDRSNRIEREKTALDNAVVDAQRRLVKAQQSMELQKATTEKDLASEVTRRVSVEAERDRLMVLLSTLGTKPETKDASG